MFSVRVTRGRLKVAAIVIAIAALWLYGASHADWSVNERVAAEAR